MTHTVAWTLSSMLACVAGLNVYWACGGRAGRGAAVPEVDGQPLFRPSRTGKLVAAMLFLAAAGLSLGSSYERFPSAVSGLVMGAVGLAFSLRAVGEFRHFGLFKRPSNSAFARWDSWFYVPLSLAFAAMSLYLARESTRHGWWL